MLPMLQCGAAIQVLSVSLLGCQLMGFGIKFLTPILMGLVLSCDVLWLLPFQVNLGWVPVGGLGYHHHPGLPHTDPYG